MTAPFLPAPGEFVSCRPAATASASLQNQRLPLAPSMRDLPVEGTRGHVIDVAAAAGVALNRAPGLELYRFFLCRLLLYGERCRRCLLPGWNRSALPGADAIALRGSLLCDVAPRVAHERPGIAVPHQLRTDIPSIGEADGERAAVPV
jgi:hypothetical protein